MHDPAEVDSNPDWFGRVFEAAVGAELCRQFDSVIYWRDGKDEVDFVVQHNGRTLAIEVKSGRIRRTSGLARFTGRYPESIPVILDLKKGTRLLEGLPFFDIIQI